MVVTLSEKHKPDVSYENEWPLVQNLRTDKVLHQQKVDLTVNLYLLACGWFPSSYSP